METVPPLARIARLIGDPARAIMLGALMDGRSRTAGELAREASITPQTASAHLGRLVEAGLLAIEKQGRHRYHRLASAEVARTLEAIMTLSAPAPPQHPLGPADNLLRRARVCYDHLAGEIAVQLTERWLQRRWVVQQDAAWSLTAQGRAGLQTLGIALPDERQRRPAVRGCLDWSERRHHVAGQLGMATLQAMLSQNMARQRRGSRVLVVTEHGQRELARWLK